MRPIPPGASTGDEGEQRTGGAAGRPILEASPNAIVGVDADARIIYVNPQAATTFGYPAGDLLGQPIEVLLPERVATRHIAHRDGFLALPRARPMGIGLDLSGRRSDGTEFPVEISLAPVQTEHGVEVYATIVDITARKVSENALAESERRFRTVLEASPNAIVGVGRDGLMTYVNPRVTESFGYHRDELIGQPLDMLLPERVRDRHMAHLTGFIANPVARPMGIGLDLAGKRKDGREFPVEISLSPVETADGMLVYANVVDITARKLAEAQLLQSQKLESVGRLAGGVAHDFNNILFAINGYAELLEEDLADGAPKDLEDTLRSIAAIHQAADRGAKLTQQLLAFSRQQIVTQKVVDPIVVVHSLEPMLRRLIGEHIRLDVRAPEAVGHVRIDPGQLDQIVMNLVVNARDAMPDGGAVTIEVATAVFDVAYALEHFDLSPGAYVAIVVSDTGEGMDRETREHIFEPFFTTKALGQGTGLGLATIYGIVQQAGGHIWLYSEPDRGSTFKIYFPLVDEPSPVEVAPVPDAVGGGTESLLLVEDEPGVRDMSKRMLERAGYAVEVVEDGRAAMEWISDGRHPIQILVTDVVMPNTSGIELAEWMLDRDPTVAIVLLSGYTAETLDLERVLARGARFVAKPMAFGDLLRAIREARTNATRQP